MRIVLRYVPCAESSASCCAGCASPVNVHATDDKRDAPCRTLCMNVGLNQFLEQGSHRIRESSIFATKMRRRNVLVSTKPELAAWLPGRPEVIHLHFNYHTVPEQNKSTSPTALPCQSIPRVRRKAPRGTAPLPSYHTPRRKKHKTQRTSAAPLVQLETTRRRFVV